MSEIAGEGKENEVASESASDEKKKPDLDATLSRLLRTKAEADQDDDSEE